MIHKRSNGIMYETKVDVRGGPGFMPDFEEGRGLKPRQTMRVGNCWLGRGPQRFEDFGDWKERAEKIMEAELEGTKLETLDQKLAFQTALDRIFGPGIHTVSLPQQQVEINASELVALGDGSLGETPTRLQLQRSTPWRSLPAAVWDRIPSVSLRPDGGVKPGIELNVPAGLRPRFAHSTAHRLPANFDNNAMVKVLLALVGRAFAGFSREDNLAWLDETLVPGSWITFSPTPRIFYVREHADFIVAVTGVGGEKLTKTFGTYEKDRIAAFYSAVRTACDQPWGADLEANEERLRRDFAAAVAAHPAGPHARVYPHATECEAAVGSCSHGRHSCRVCKRDGIPCDEFHGATCVRCDIAYFVRRGAIDARSHPVGYTDAQRAQRLGVANLRRGFQSEALTGMATLPTRGAMSEDGQTTTDILTALLRGERPSAGDDGWPDHLTYTFLEALRDIETTKARWTHLKDLVMAFGLSRDQPCKWDLTREQAPVFHSDGVLDDVTWWYNAAKNKRSPLAVALAFAAAALHHAGDDSHHARLADLLGRIAPVEAAWNLGRGSGRLLASRIFSVVYEDGEDDGIIRDLARLPTVPQISPRRAAPAVNAVYRERADTFDADMQSGGTAQQAFHVLDRSFRTAELVDEAIRPSSKTTDLIPVIEEVFGHLEAIGAISPADRLRPDSAFPGLWWAGDESVGPEDILVMALRLLVQLIFFCDWVQITCTIEVTTGSFTSIVVSIMVFLAVHRRTDALTGLPIGPFPHNHPLRLSLGHDNHAFTANVLAPCIPELDAGNPTRQTAEALVRLVRSTAYNVRLESPLSNFAVKRWRASTLHAMVDSIRSWLARINGKLGFLPGVRFNTAPRRVLEGLERNYVPESEVEAVMLEILAEEEEDDDDAGDERAELGGQTGV
ncbi:uncharacterized protein PFL1_02780 [Pseudozyma flocculosa PF-1]|nr:uncharacterized protein PFL1_02780 [Pseudozyma flocculosa PF-1]EPQ29561.1 hypothetical protein PFL1_02780 [Pseudozyma flocculosa PF-1]